MYSPPSPARRSGRLRRPGWWLVPRSMLLPFLLWPSLGLSRCLEGPALTRAVAKRLPGAVAGWVPISTLLGVLCRDIASHRATGLGRRVLRIPLGGQTTWCAGTSVPR